MDRRKLSLVVVLVVVLVIALAGCKKAGKTSADLGLTPGETASGSESNSNGTAGGSGGAKSQTPTPSVAPANNGGTSGGSTNTDGNDDGTANTGGSGSGSKKPSDSNTTPTGGKTLVVKILWWNDTNSKAPEGCEIVFGTSSFKPSASKDSVTGSIGPVPLGTPSQLIVYPDGRSGKKIVVPFAVDASMQADSERDAIHVEISDTRVRVLGNPIDGFDKTFDRF